MSLVEATKRMLSDADAAGAKVDARVPHSPTSRVSRGTWPPLKTLPEVDVGEPAAFPFDSLGAILGPAAAAIHRDVQVPDAVAAGSVLAAASLAAMPHVDVVLPHGQRAPLSLFIFSGANSGERKSAADQIVQREVEEIRREQARKYLAERAASAGDKDSPKPIARSLTIGKATVEGLQMVLANQSFVGLFSAEGGELLGGHSLREERRVAGLAWLLKAWGGETLDALTRGDGLSILLGRRVALHVMAQPVLLRGLMADPLAREQGLLPRCLISQPKSLAGSRMFKDVNPGSSSEIGAFHRSMHALLRTRPPILPDGDGYELQPMEMRMSADARALWIEFHDESERAQAPGGEFEFAKAFASKLPEHAARIAAVVQMVSNPAAGELQCVAMDCGMTAAMYYMGEHIRLTGAGSAERRSTLLRSLVEWFVGRGPSVPHKDVLQRAPRPVRDLRAEGIAKLLDELVERHYIRRVGDAWEVNPNA
jgi:putative DNA primase/helicase